MTYFPYKSNPWAAAVTKIEELSGNIIVFPNVHPVGLWRLEVLQYSSTARDLGQNVLQTNNNISQVN